MQPLSRIVLRKMSSARWAMPGAVSKITCENFFSVMRCLASEQIRRWFDSLRSAPWA
jgi:hypothetical protein